MSRDSGRSTINAPGEGKERGQTSAPGGPTIFHQYYAPVNHIGQANNAHFGVNNGWIGQTCQSTPAGHWAGVSGWGPHLGAPPFDLFSVLNPILDASHTRNLKVSPPNSKCFATTRKLVIAIILCWARADLSWQGPHIMWIYGYAGCGKSAIAQTVAEQLEREGRLAASFFFFRGSGDRSGITRFATTIAHQLAQNIPEIASLIEEAARANPGLLSASTSSLINQFERLIYRPIMAMGNSLRSRPVIIALDGVDECEDREEVASFIEEMITFFRTNPLTPLRVVITSRVEDHIHRELHSSSQVRLLNLVKHTSDDDISAALDVAITKGVRGRAMPGDGSWPSRQDKRKLVRHIGGSYIFMTTIVKLLFAPSKQDGLTPMERLPKVLEMKPDFDDLYIEILKPCAHFPFFSEIITTIALAFEPLSITQIAELLDIKTFKVTNVLINLHAIMQIPGDDRSPVTLWHTSLRNFLCTEGRSGPFFASPEHHCCLARGAVKMAASPLNSHSHMYARRFAVAHLSKLAHCSNEGLTPFRTEDHSTVLILDKPVFGGSDCFGGLPALEAACDKRDWKLVRALVNWHANVNIQFRGSHQSDFKVALNAACHNMAKETVYFLLEKGANPNIASQLSLSSNWDYYAFPLAWAAIEGDVDLVNRLLACGADPNLKGGYYGSALHVCALDGKNEKIVQILLEHGADPNIQGQFGSTPLHWASQADHTSIVKCLLEFQADPNMNNRDRWTPLHLACYCGHLEVAEYLLDHNADPSIRNYFGETALQVAKESDQPGTGEVVKMLRRRSIAK